MIFSAPLGSDSIDTPLPSSWKGRSLRSTDSVLLAEKVPDFRSGTLFFIPSPLDPHQMRSFQNQLPPDCFFLFHEKDPELAAKTMPLFSQLKGQTDQGQEIFYWLVHDTEMEIQNLAAQLPWNKLRRTVFLTVSSSWMFHPTRYRQIESRLSDEIQVYWMNRSTSLNLGPLWIKNIFRNLQENATTFSPWPNWGHDPVLVAGAGTSLEETLRSYPLDLGKRFRILAADTALTVLTQAGWQADAAVCVEAQQANLKDFQGLSGSELPLFLDLCGHPGSTRLTGGRVHPFISRFASVSLNQRLENLGFSFLPPLGSVGVTAVALALRLTQGPILLTGLDFAFPGGKTHAKDAPSLLERRKKSNRFFTQEIPGCWANGLNLVRDGVLTTRIMEGYAGSLQNLIQPEYQRIFDLNQGLSLGLKRQTWKEMIPQIQNWPILGSHRPGPAQLETRQTLTHFIQEERTRTLVYLSALEKVNKGNHSPEDQEALLEAARDLDHLYFFYPDTQPMPRFDSGFLSRLLMGVHWHRERLKDFAGD